MKQFHKYLLRQSRTNKSILQYNKKIYKWQNSCMYSIYGFSGMFVSHAPIRIRALKAAKQLKGLSARPWDPLAKYTYMRATKYFENNISPAHSADRNSYTAIIYLPYIGRLVFMFAQNWHFYPYSIHVLIFIHMMTAAA